MNIKITYKLQPMPNENVIVKKEQDIIRAVFEARRQSLERQIENVLLYGCSHPEMYSNGEKTKCPTLLENAAVNTG